MQTNIIYNGDSLATLSTLPSESVQTCVTSPPYFGLRNYGVDGQIGLEESPEQYVSKLVEVFREVRRVLKNDGTAWLNLGDSYANSLKESGRNDEGRKAAKGLNSNAPVRAMRKRNAVADGIKPKDLIGIPWRVAFALQADGWYLRQDIIWAKPNPMPESVRDRCTRAHEYVFLLSKSAKYFYDADAVKEPCIDSVYRAVGKVRPSLDSHYVSDGERGRTKAGLSNQFGGREFRNRRSVWTVTPKPFKEAHFAVMPEALVEPCILAGSRPGDLVLDPFSGAGTVAAVAKANNRRYIGIDLNPEYCQIARERIAKVSLKSLLQAA